jgi:hypothetical protein
VNPPESDENVKLEVIVVVPGVEEPVIFVTELSGKGAVGESSSSNTALPEEGVQEYKFLNGSDIREMYCESSSNDHIAIGCSLSILSE